MFDRKRHQSTTTTYILIWRLPIFPPHTQQCMRTSPPRTVRQFGTCLAGARVHHESLTTQHNSPLQNDQVVVVWTGTVHNDAMHDRPQVFCVNKVTSGLIQETG
jgi:hypothetical protein